jgi:hypothetical protein
VRVARSLSSPWCAGGDPTEDDEGAAITVTDFDLQSFSPHVGTSFDALFEDVVTTLVLMEATPLAAEGAPPPGDRAPFSLIFTGPAEGMPRQGTYEMRHAALGTFPMFIVPLGIDAGTVRYQAIFY